MTSESVQENTFKRFNIPKERADFCWRLTEIGALTNRWSLTNLDSSVVELSCSVHLGITRQYLSDNETNTRNRLFSQWFSVTWLGGLERQTSTKWDFEINSIPCLAFFYIIPKLRIFASPVSMWDMRITSKFCKVSGIQYSPWRIILQYFCKH